ncbi:MAG: MBL fold metallo-hydrolase [Beijerinckiaceae bacterium]|nr:MBL fold metallo-hydrolase [Beijerinckiaceae bacterium]
MSNILVSAMNRRAFLLSAATAPLLASGAVHARAPLLGVKSPAWYRFNVGDFEVTVVSDGVLDLGTLAGVYPGTPKPTVDGFLKSELQPVDKALTPENCLVVNTGDKLVLIDSGVGSYSTFGAGAGRLVKTLASAGIKAEDIDTILLTHAHIDHVSGIMGDDGKRLYPNAQIILSKVEHDFWTDDAKLSATGVLKLLVDAARKNLVPNKDRIAFVEPGKEAVKGISVVSTPGHSPGHVSYLISSGGKSLLYTGDAVTHPLISFKQPAWEFAFDGDAKAAAATRIKLLDMATADNLTMIGYHFPFPGIGNALKEGNAYRFVPAALEF